VEFEPGRHLTLVARRSATRCFGPIALTYQVQATAGGSRLICCVDATARSRADRIRRRLLAAGDLVMMRKQLLTFKELAEQSSARPA